MGEHFLTSFLVASAKRSDKIVRMGA